MSEPFNDLKQVEMSVAAAQKMVGSATMSMDPELIQSANSAIQDAKSQLNSAKNNATGVDGDFLARQESLIQQVEQQLSEAQH